MTLQLGDLAPDFTAPTTQGTVRFHQWKGTGWAVLFSHPKDFTPVCTTELATLARLKPEFDRRNTRVIGLSVDPLESHRAWEKDVAELARVPVNFPLISDPDQTVASLYGMVHPNASDSATVRSVFMIGPDHRIRLMLTYPMSTGRSFPEILRVLDALQLTAAYQVSTPADWNHGDDVIIPPSVSEEEARRRFPRGWTSSKPYLRVTPQPDRV